MGAFTFYHIWIPHYAHIVEPLYGLQKKGRKLEWQEEHSEAVQRLKGMLTAAPALRKAIYGKESPVFITMDTSLTGISRVINQEKEGGTIFAIQFSAEVLSERQRGYTQVKRELWGIISVVKADKDYLIGTDVIIETDCLPILGMVFGCRTPDLVMVKWIEYIKSLNPEIRHISGKDNNMADMLSRVHFEGRDDMVLEDDEVGVDFFESARLIANKPSTPALHRFNEDD